ncbi:hypothetical protein COLO4_20035 [Corchorus olitorius]|uniref:Uncharacterized protein n=1 Tax=Corchorus olitorius TaxID=93759 RepID=A0A1R3J218_9ROSI|nr:hypothetical protein COLO4_20035 [Corchorus olitorius]
MLQLTLIMKLQMEGTSKKAKNRGKKQARKKEAEVEIPDVSHIAASRKNVTSKKRTRSEDGLSDLVAEIHEYVGVYKETNKHIEGIARAMEKDAAGGDRRLSVFDEIMELGGFSNQQVMDAGEHILKDLHKVDTFFGLPKLLRKDYVLKQLSEANPYRPSFDFNDLGRD